jgi:hypothetical protein
LSQTLRELEAIHRDVASVGGELALAITVRRVRRGQRERWVTRLEAALDAVKKLPLE